MLPYVLVLLSLLSTRHAFEVTPESRGCPVSPVPMDGFAMEKQHNITWYVRGSTGRYKLEEGCRASTFTSLNETHYRAHTEYQGKLQYEGIGEKNGAILTNNVFPGRYSVVSTIVATDYTRYLVLHTCSTAPEFRLWGVQVLLSDRAKPSLYKQILQGLEKAVVGPISAGQTLKQNNACQ